MVSEEYAFMASSQAMYILASRYSFRYILSLHAVTICKLVSDERQQQCAVTAMGPNLFDGNLVFVWKKGSPYGPILNF